MKSPNEERGPAAAAADRDLSSARASSSTRSGGDSPPRLAQEEEEEERSNNKKQKTVRQRLRGILWDTLDRSPEERRFLAKIDFFILTWASLTYFSKNLNTNNLCTWRGTCTWNLGPGLFLTCLLPPPFPPSFSPGSGVSQENIQRSKREGGKKNNTNENTGRVVLALTSVDPLANAYVSGMKEELNVVGNEYQTFTTMWTM